MENRNYIVYRHIAPSGKMYVGITGVGVKHRWQNGRGYKNNRHFNFAIRKYGWENIKHEILLDGLSEQEAKFAEEVFISYWNLTDSKYGYNVLSGGETYAGSNNPFFGKTHTNESKKKMSISSSGINHPNYGKHLSMETRNKISNSTKGRVHSLETRNKLSASHIGNHSRPFRAVVAMCIKDKRVYTFDSIKNASIITGVTKSNICLCCQGHRQSAGGYVWKYK